MAQAARSPAAGWFPPRLWELVTALTLAFAAGPGPLIDEAAHRSLTVHMGLQHWLLMASGGLGAWALAGGSGRSPEGVAPGIGHRPLAGARLLTALSLATVSLWHVPAAFGWAVGDPTAHGVMHLSFVAAGAAAAWGLPRLPAFERALLVLSAMALMGPLSLAMAAGALTYPYYPAGQAAGAGVAMLVSMQIGWIAVALAPAGARIWRRSRALRLASLVALALAASGLPS